MCGISLILSRSADGLAGAITRMVGSMPHRGPDGHGTLLVHAGAGPSVAFGHNRLSIIDLSDQAAQPIRSADGRYVMVYNGEVYNYRELAQDLDTTTWAAGYGDTAVVLAALAKWGPDAFARFNGMWAILFYDTLEQTLLVSRDRFGVKPLYVYEESERLYFASEIKAILAGSRARLPVNPDVAIPYLTRGLLNFSEGTFFEGITQFPTASWQVIDLKRPWRESPPQRYWYHPVERGESPGVGHVRPDEVRELLIDSVRLRLRSDVPVGVLLSGGLDSSSIVGAIADLGVLENVTILSVTSNDRASNEEPFIDEMARHAQLVPQKVNVSSDPLLLWNRLPEACWFNDEPVCGVADLAEQRLMELARSKGIRVLLSGQGADEQLGGYNKFLYFWLYQLMREGRWTSAIATFVRFARHSDTLYEFKLSEAIRYLDRGRLAKKTFIASAHHGRDTVDIGVQRTYTHREWLDLVQTSVPALLHYEDRMSMSYSVEVRVPFLDYRLVECLARVHPSEKFRDGWTKSILRTAIKGLVPEPIRYRRDKKGFTVPENDWMRGAFRRRVLDLFASPMRAEAHGLIDRTRLNDLYQRYLSGHGYLNGRHFFRVCAFETFLRRFGDHLEGRP